MSHPPLLKHQVLCREASMWCLIFFLSNIFSIHMLFNEIKWFSAGACIKQSYISSRPLEHQVLNIKTILERFTPWVTFVVYNYTIGHLSLLTHFFLTKSTFHSLTKKANILISIMLTKIKWVPKNFLLRLLPPKFNLFLLNQIWFFKKFV